MRLQRTRRMRSIPKGIARCLESLIACLPEAFRLPSIHADEMCRCRWATQSAFLESVAAWARLSGTVGPPTALSVRGKGECAMRGSRQLPAWLSSYCILRQSKSANGPDMFFQSLDN